MKLIMENWKKFISEDTLEEKQSAELRNALRRLITNFGRLVFSKNQQKNQEQKFIDKYENFVDPELQTEEDKATYIKKRDEKIALAKNYLALKAAEQKAQTPQDEKKIKQAEDKVDQKAAKAEEDDIDLFALMGIGPTPAEEPIYKNYKDTILAIFPDMKGSPEQIIRNAQVIYSGLFDNLFPEGSEERQGKIPLLNSANNAISEYVKSKGTALNQSGEPVLMGVSNLGDPEEETIRNVLLKGLNLALGLEADARPWDSKSTAPSTETTEDIIKKLNTADDIEKFRDHYFNALKLFNKSDKLKAEFDTLLDLLYKKPELLDNNKIIRNYISGLNQPITDNEQFKQFKYSDHHSKFVDLMRKELNVKDTAPSTTIDTQQLRNIVAQAQSSQQKLDIIVDAAVEVATKDNKEPDVAAREVLQELDPNASEEIVDAVIKGTEEEVKSTPEETPEKLKQFQDSEFYNSIQDDQAKQGLSFIFKYFIDNQIISEGLKDVVIGLGIKPSDLRKALMKLKVKEVNVFKKVVAFLKDENNTNAFVDAMKNFIPQSADAEQPAKEGEVEVIDDGRKYTYTDENIQKLKTAYQKFEDGFMTAPDRVQQEELWIALRNALNAIGQFREIGRKERAYIGEQLINIFENENQQNFKRIVVDIERLRRDLNDTDDTLIKYLEAANAGKYESQAYLARFLAELKDVQNSVKRTVEDVQKVGGFKLNEDEQPAAEPKEETFEQKVAKVRGVYENIKSQFSETLTQLDKTNAPELEEFSGRIKDAYDQLESIRYLFSRVGAFAKTSNKDVDELQEDYKIAKGKLTKAMSRTLSDLRAGQVDPNQLKVFLTDLLDVADWISTYFGVGPDEQYRVQGVIIQSDGKDKKETAENTDDSGGEPLTPEAAEEGETEEAPPAAIMPDPDEVERAKVDVVKFLSDSNKFIKNFTTPLLKILNNQESNDEDKVTEINKLKTEMTKKRMLQEKDEDIGSIVQKAYNAEATIKDVFRNIPTTKFVEEKLNILKVIKAYLEYRKKFDELQKTEPDEFDEWNSDIKDQIQQLAAIAGKVVKDSIDDPEIKNALLSQVKDPEDAPEATVIKQQRTARNLERTRELGRTSKIKQVLKSPYGEKDYGKDPTRYMEESKNLLERLIKQELKVLNGKKMVRN